MEGATYLYDDGSGSLVLGVFDPTIDRVFMSGNFTVDENWPEPGTLDKYELLPNSENQNSNQLLYSNTFDIITGNFQYKYFIVNDNQTDPWDYDEWEGNPNRALYIDSSSEQLDSWGIVNASDKIITIGQSITITSPNLVDINDWQWTFGEGASPSSASGIGPHEVTYSTVGNKTISLVLNSSYGFTLENFIIVGNSPSITGVSETELGTDYAILECNINPNNFETTVWFEYGETTELGNQISMDDTYFGDINHAIEVTLDGLTENTSYFYRFVAENIFGQTASEVTELRTACSYTIYTDNPTGPESVCGGGNSTYSTSSENAESYVWEINPASAGSTESTTQTAQITWDASFTGDAQIRVRGVSGTCNSEWSNYLSVYVNNTVSDIEIIGETEVCTNSEILYNLSRPADDTYEWEVIGGSIIAETNQVSIIRWNSSGSKLLRVTETDEGGCPIFSEITVTVNSTIAPEVPVIHRKGSINILICTTPEMDYKWYKDGSVISGQTGQYIVARNNLGFYNVQITDGECPTTSNPLQLSTYAMAESVLSVFPNPSSGSFTIEALGETVGSAVVRVSNSFGNILYEQKVEKTDYLYQQQLNIPNLPQGVYIVSLQVEGEMAINAKLTIY